MKRNSLLYGLVSQTGSGILFVPSEYIRGHCVPIFTYLGEGSGLCFARGLQHTVTVPVQTATFSAESPWM